MPWEDRDTRSRRPREDEDRDGGDAAKSGKEQGKTLSQRPQRECGQTYALACILSSRAMRERTSPHHPQCVAECHLGFGTLFHHPSLLGHVFSIGAKVIFLKHKPKSLPFLKVHVCFQMECKLFNVMKVLLSHACLVPASPPWESFTPGTPGPLPVPLGPPKFAFPPLSKHQPLVGLASSHPPTYSSRFSSFGNPFFETPHLGAHFLRT